MTTSVSAPARQGIGSWRVDPAHTSAQFAVRHLMISTVRGRFGEITGSVSPDPSNPKQPVVEATINVASIDTGVAQRDAHLRSADFFDAERWPAITFRSRRIDGDTSGKFRVVGDLTIRDVTREVVLEVESQGSGPDPWGNERAGFSATTQIDRRDFGLTWNLALETGGITVGHEVRITIDVELVRSVEPGVGV